MEAPEHPADQVLLDHTVPRSVAQGARVGQVYPETIAVEVEVAAAEVISLAFRTWEMHRPLLRHRRVLLRESTELQEAGFLEVQVEVDAIDIIQPNTFPEMAAVPDLDAPEAPEVLTPLLPQMEILHLLTEKES